MSLLDSRFVSALLLVASVGMVLYLGAMDFIIWQSVWHGSATLTFDYLEPSEAYVVVPFLILMAVVLFFREVRRLAGRGV
jgi:hypothetical protein